MKAFIFSHFIIFIILSGCSLTSRQFIDEMDRDSDGFFTHGTDFEVIGGDSGQRYRSEREILRRTPAAHRSYKSKTRRMDIQDELVKKERSLSEREYHHYQKYRTRLANDSERLYFLGLKTSRERDDYAAYKGLSAPRSFEEGKRAISNQDILMEMTKEEVLKSWGRPQRIDVAGNPAYENERWAFYRRGRIHYIFFEDGRVQGWSQK